MRKIDQAKGTTSPLGARASNAGDLFHELWSLRSALQLLIPKTELKAVTLEGIAAPDAAGYQYDGVDCALFHGAPTVEAAKKIELIQLKYSTAAPNAPWTIARLSAATAKQKDNSVLRKLAETFSKVKSLASPEAHIVVKLVSNQPVADEVTETIKAIRNHEPPTALATKLIAATGLSDLALQEFLQAFDLSELGVTSRETLFDSLNFAVSEIIGGSADTQMMILQGNIRRFVLPGTETERITQNTVLSWFGLANLTGLFPAPQDLKPAINPIRRRPAQDVLDAILGGQRVVCLHGQGGCGKTTTVMQLTEMLPPGSISVTFDCYGAGRYTGSNDRRHLPENAFLQIANELAWAQETPFLVANASGSPASIKTFFQRVERSATILTASNPDALLAIVVDAADNSVAAAELSTPPSQCFVWEIAQSHLADLPSNVRIIFSTRTARKDKLRLPTGTVEIPCPPFDLAETRAFALSRYPTVSEVWIEQFHALSSGVPRVQAYAFARGGASPEATLDSLRPSGKKLDTVLRELFQDASSRFGDHRFYPRFVAALITLPAPIPIGHLAAICARTREDALDFITDVQPTLRLEDDTVTIADEDVEDFLQQEAAPQVPQLLGEICDYFAAIFRTDEYAAVHYCDFLARAARWVEILPIVEKDLLPAGISDPIQRREVQLRRLRLALGACRSAKSETDTIKVVLLSAEAAKDEDSFRELLEQETDLSVRFASSSLVRLVLSDRDRSPQQGSILAQDAAYAALRGDFVSARERLSAFTHWGRRRSEVPDREWNSWKITDDDIVAVVESIALMEGAAAGVTAAMRWKPVKLWPKIGEMLVPRLLAQGKRQLVQDAYDQNLLPAPWNLLLTVPLALSGFDFSSRPFGEELRSLKRSNVPELRSQGLGNEGVWELSYLETIVTACEIGFSRNVDKGILASALDLILDHRRSPSSSITRLETSKLDIALRAWVLQKFLKQAEAKSSDFVEWLKDNKLPEPKKKRGRPRKKPKVTPTGQRDEEMSRTIKAIFPIYESRLAVLREAALGSGSITGIPKAQIAGIASDAYYFDRDHWSGEFRRRAGQSIVRLMHIDGISIDHLRERAEALTKGNFDDAFASRSLAVWHELILRPGTHQSIIEGIAERAARLRDVRTGARDKSGALVKFSRLALNFSESDAKALFEKAVEIVQETDREAMVQIKFIAQIAQKHGPFSYEEGGELAAKFAAYVTDVGIRLEGEEYFPWQEAMNGLFALCPSVAVAAASQWQDEGISGLEETLPVISQGITELPNDRLLLACALIILLPRPHLSMIQSLAKKAATATEPVAVSAFELLAQHCLMHEPLGQRTEMGNAILLAIPAGLAAGPCVQKLKEMVVFSHREEPARTEQYARAQPDIQFPHDSDFNTASGIIAAIVAAREANRANYVGLSTILAAARNQITAPAQRVPFLEAVSAFRGDSLEVDDRAEILLSALEDWRGGPAVERWRTMELPRIISENIWALSRWTHEHSVALNRLLDASGLPAKTRVEVIAKGLEDGPDGFSSVALFGIAVLMSPGVSEKEMAHIAEWYIGRVYQAVPNDIVARFVAKDIPADFDDAMARFLFAQMSDIDLRVRWRAAHCVRLVVNSFGSAPLSALFNVYDRAEESSFRLGTAPFYWMAARLWLTITAARLAIENPSATAGVGQKLFAITQDKEFPHYLIRRYAKHALKALLRSRAIAFSVRDLNKLKLANEPLKPTKKLKKGDHRGLERFESKKRRFSFDSTDTVPYWYSPLFRHFATLTADAFYRTLEKWLIDRWKIDPEANWWSKEPRKARLSGGAEMRSSHRQGSMPSIERYGTYLEWHAMHCGLGEWLRTEPLASPESHWDSFDHYVRRWDPTEPPTWLSDRRSIVPLEHDLVFDEGGDDKHWLRRVPKGKYLAAVIGDGDLTKFVIEGDWSISRPTRETKIEISSALVSTDTAISLLQTLKRADPHQFHLPFERERDDDDIKNDEFVLRSWVGHPERETQFDDDDPLRNDISALRTRPAKWLLKQFKLKPAELPTSSWRDIRNNIWFNYRAWSDFTTEDQDGRHRPRSAGSYGHRVLVSSDALGAILEREKLDLIVKVEYERRLENEYERSSSWGDEKKRRETQKFFVFRQDGTIDDESGNIGTWRRTGRISPKLRSP